MSPIDPVLTEAVTRPIHQIERTYIRVPFLGVRWSLWCHQCDRWLTNAGDREDCADAINLHTHQHGPTEVTP